MTQKNPQATAPADAVKADENANAPETANAADAAQADSATPETKKEAPVPAVPKDVAAAARKRAAAEKNGGNSEAEKMITALEHERKGYVVRGNEERIAEVDAQIAYWKKQK